jgi:hypothetical protein
MNALLIGAAVVIIATALVHSILGERRVIPVLRRIDAGALPRRPRAALHFTWHFSSLLMGLTALTVAWPGSPVPLVALIGAAYLLVGLLAFAMTRGRHPSGPMFTSAGVLALLGALGTGE